MIIRSSFYRKYSKGSFELQETLTLDSGVKLLKEKLLIIIEIPFTSSDGVYYKIEQEYIEISNDIRSLYSKGDKISMIGINSLVLFGAMVPPYTLFENIHAFLPGHIHEINTKTFEINAVPDCQWSSPIKADYTLPPEEQSRILSTKIDQTLKELCPAEDPIVLFSGGVDSCLLAMRTIALGWQKSSYVHYSFGKADPETIIAQEIASALGIHLKILPHDLDEGFKCLDNAMALYKHPFCDHGAVQGFVLVKNLISEYGRERVVIDGTGAEADFGSFSFSGQVNNLFRIPQFIRKYVGGLYSTFDLWHNRSIFEYYIRIIRRSAYLSKLATFIAITPLSNISYFISEDDLALLSSACGNLVRDISTSENLEETISLLRLGLLCPGKSSKNLKSLLSNNEVRLRQPFMEHQIIDLGLHHARYWPGSRYPKNSLKRLLATNVPNRLVYRKKQGFLGPLVEKFSHPVFISHLDNLKDRDSPLYGFVNHNMLKKMRAYLISSKELPLQSYNFLWAVTFINTWISQLYENHKHVINNIKVHR